MEVGSWPYWVKWRAREPPRGKWRGLFSLTTRVFLLACGQENGARSPNHPISPKLTKSQILADFRRIMCANSPEVAVNTAQGCRRFCHITWRGLFAYFFPPWPPCACHHDMWQKKTDGPRARGNTNAKGSAR